MNQALAAIDNFYRSLGAGRPDVAEELAQTAPRALDEAQQRTFLRFVAASPSARDRAIATVFFYTGLRLSELAALDMTDVAISARRGRATIRTGKGDAYREVPLNSVCRTAVAGVVHGPDQANALRSRRREWATGRRRRSPRRCGFRARGRGWVAGRLTWSCGAWLARPVLIFLRMSSGIRA